MRKTFILILIIMTSGYMLSGLFAADADTDIPRWLMLEKGKQAILDRELGDGLRIFRSILGDASTRGESVPEAEMWLGYIFEQEGEKELAVEQYNRALDNSDALYVKEDKFTILYRLANLYESTYQYGKYEQTLNRIINADSEDSGADATNLLIQEAMFNVLLRDGVDKLFILYRKDERKLQPAFSRLGLYHYKTALFREAVRNLISTLITPVTNTVEYMRLQDFEYEYTNLSDFILDSRDEPYISDYLNEVMFIKNLYYLAASMHGLGRTEQAKYIWRAIVRNAPDSGWRDRSNSQLTEPFIEPLLTPSRFE